MEQLEGANEGRLLIGLHSALFILIFADGSRLASKVAWRQIPVNPLVAPNFAHWAEPEPELEPELELGIDLHFRWMDIHSPRRSSVIC